MGRSIENENSQGGEHDELRRGWSGVAIGIWCGKELERGEHACRLHGDSEGSESDLRTLMFDL